ncbi:4-alpha-glucanotransferase [Halorarius litoreus]|uniref:4-alpha-glucanotransferase n=1 Tax=Halorarius litoreus TaxID=2962676 RepID=UPI0020CE08EF|nr:4-alpha-glucanotransferase [Halorarius litoreus]
MQFDREAGVLLHVTALPGPDGVGTLGEPAHVFLEWLDRAGASVWQFCPLGPTSGIHGDSPYQSPSAFAGNPTLVDLDALVEAGWLHASDLDDRPAFDPHHVEFERVKAYTDEKLREAFEAFDERADPEAHEAFEAFREREADWLEDYALYDVLKGEYEAAWTDWPADVRLRDPDALAAAREEHADEIEYRAFRQFCFDRQWQDLRAAASERGIDLVGDVPIYVAADSVDVWANPDAFDLDEENRPASVAGVPPDLDAGQRWGNPLYDWDALAANGYDWWVRRFRRLYDLVDVVRIDHFKGFERFWAIPTDADDPSEGEWREAPGRELFETVADELGSFRAIAEDLGHLTPELHALREAVGVPGMRVPLYADWCAENHMYLPHTYPEDCVGYTGTHDTDTVVGWYQSSDDRQRECANFYLDTDGTEVNWDVLDAVWRSDAELAVTPLQDVLGLGSDARFNTPGTLGGNWDWRVTWEGLDDGLADRLRELTEYHGRL